MNRYLILAFSFLAVTAFPVAENLGNIAEDSTIYFYWSTNGADGAAITRSVDGTISVYKDGSVVQSVAGVTDTEDHDGDVGTHLLTIDTSADVFYATGSSYGVKLTTATIDGISVSRWLAHFSIENRFDEVDLAKILGVVQSATDLKDFADAGYDPGTDKVQGVVLVDTTTANTDVRGTDNAALASVATEARLAELDAGNIPASIAALNDLSSADVAAELATYDGPTRAEATSDKDEILAVVATAQADLDIITGPAGVVMAAASITAAVIAADAIGASEVAADAIGASEIAADAIGASEVATDAIGAAELAADAIGASEIGTDAIDADALAADAVTEIWAKAHDGAETVLAAIKKMRAVMVGSFSASGTAPRVTLYKQVDKSTTEVSHDHASNGLTRTEN